MLSQYNQPSSPQETAQSAMPQRQGLPADSANGCSPAGETHPGGALRPDDAGAPPSLRLATPTDAAYEYLHHFLIGSPQGVDAAVERLHLLRYVEHRLWTPHIAIGERGLTITQAEGQVLRYLVRSRPRASL